MHLPLLWISLAYIAGIVLASLVTFSVYLWLGLALAAGAIGLITYLLFKRFKPEFSFLSSPYFIIIPAAVALLLGAARYQGIQPKISPDFIAWYNDRQYDLLITGQLVEPPDYRDTYTNLHIHVEKVDAGNGNYEVDGLLLVRVSSNELYRYGDILRLRGRPKTPPENEDFSYRDYLAGQGIHSYLSSAEVTRLPSRGKNPIIAAIYGIKEKALSNIYFLFPDPEASLLAGILLGVDTGLPPDLQAAFKNTGTAHIIAISGFNITIIAGIFVALFGRLLGQRRGAIFAVIGICLYTFLVGADAAVVRSAIMGGMSLFARQFGRRQDGLNTLGFIAAAMALVNPYVLWDVGFQLSFFATLGLVLYADPFTQAFVRFARRWISVELTQKVAAPVSEFVLLTLAAQLTTLPIMAYHFKSISLVSLIANPFILPAQPAVMIFSGIAVLLSLIYQPLGMLAAWFAWPFSVYTIRVVELFDLLPHGTLALGKMSLLFVLLFYLILFGWTFAGHRIRAFFAVRFDSQPTTATTFLITALGISTFLIWRAALVLPDKNLHMTFFDVGTGDAVLIRTPSGENLLINGGPSPALLSEALGRRLSPFDRTLDWLVVASTQENQVNSLPRTLDRFPARNVLWSGKTDASYSARLVDQWLAGQAVPMTTAEEGQVLDLGNGAQLTVLATTSRGAILLVEWQNFRAILPIGMTFNALVELNDGKAIGSVTVLLLADGGYAPSNPVEWIDNLNPEVIILSVEAGDKDGLPHEKTLEAVGGHSLVRTDRHGWVQVTTDGEEMWVEVEKASAGTATAETGAETE
ncbi:MAG: ComEC/Rec2 family competence protein [Anaerolineales bacterium]|nr:ComEC/Rec2 family competence protein [Anaerolineales bacterium]